jgi:fucose permease
MISSGIWYPSILSDAPKSKLDPTLNILRKAKGFSNLNLVLLAYIAFIALGMPDGLLGIAWPSMRADFSIPLDSLGMLLFSSVTGYMTSSFLSGTLIAWMGVGNLLTVSCVLTSSALLGYSLVPSWWMMVLLGVVGGLGAGAIDAGLNTYAAAHFSEGLMQWLHASWGIGITLGPVIMTFVLATQNSWRIGYRIVGGFQLLLALCFILTLQMWNQEDNSAGSDESRFLIDVKATLGETMRQPQVWLSILLFFLYVGAEISLGTWTYSLLVESRGIPPTTAGFWTGSFWATFTIGRILAGLYANRVGVHLLVQGSLVGALLGAALLIWNPSDTTNILAVALIGFSIAPIFPALMSGTSGRVGARFTANTIGMQMTATGLGGAMLPSLMGVLADQFTLEVVPICLMIVFLGLFGFYRLSMK